MEYKIKEGDSTLKNSTLDLYPLFVIYIQLCEAKVFDLPAACFGFFMKVTVQSPQTLNHLFVIKANSAAPPVTS